MTGAANRPRRRQCGFAYLALMLAVAAMGVALAATGEAWWLVQQREKEQQLLFVGGEFRRAIASYAAQAANDKSRYPRRLEDLLLDPRVPGVRRHLRKIYVDPITGSDRWGLVKGSNGDVYGVYSLSDDAPLKRAGFAEADAAFAGAAKYSIWVFTPIPSLQRAAAPRPAVEDLRRPPPRRL